MSQPVSLSAMQAAPEMAAGNYSASFLFRIFLNQIDGRFPGAAALIEKAADVLPWAKLSKVIFNAIAAWQEGKDFLTILQEMLQESVEIETPSDGPVRMMAKP